MSAKAELRHEHTVAMAGRRHELAHAHLVDLETPEHVHPITRKTSYGRFVLEQLRGAQRLAGVTR